MKTILYNPIFINPQAYYVFPRLTRYLQPDNESTSEPANYIGTIEVKVIAYGDTTLKRTYTNTDSIDLSEFKNTWIRISLFTKVGSCVLGEWKIGNMESDLPHIDPEVLASLKAVVIVGNKTNNDSDRAIVKNLVDPDNPFVISNAAYTEGSGYADKGSPYYGAFVTDGIDDLITSTKTVQEMLGGSNECTVLSMMQQINESPDGVIRNNWLFIPSYRLTNIVSTNSLGKLGIYGYTSSSISENNISTINNVLGDKNDYSVSNITESSSTLNYFSVEGYKNPDGGLRILSQVAWYWTIIANKVLTTDQINQVIAYFNLDRTLKPDILCNVKKQGITNENHAEFGDKLIDYSGNGRDIQLNNLAWEGNSGIGNYPVIFGANKTWKNLRTEDNNLSYKLIANSITVYKVLPNTGAIMWTYIKENEIIREIEIPSFTVKVSGTKNGDRVRYYYVDENSTFKNTIFDITEDGTYVLPKCNKLQITESTPSTNIFIGFVIILNDNPSTGVTIEVIPSNENTICLDGVDDYGKVTGMPIYKDYTFIIDRQIISIGDTAGIVASKSEDSADATKHGAFIFEYLAAPDKISTWSFYKDNGQVANTDFTRGISYQSKYSYNGKDLTVGTSKDSDKLWLGTIRDRDSRFFNGAIYSLMSFPYSMNKFLIERQLKKHKLGTLYPNMVEFRPVIKSSVELASKPTFVIRGTSTLLNAGDYIPENSEIWVVITMNNAADRITKFVINGNTIDIPSSAYNPSTMKYGFPFTIDNKSPQKITMTIEQDENYVKWNPVVESNVEYASISYLLRIPGQGTVTPVIGQYYPILSTDTSLVVYVATNGVDEVANLTINGQEPTSSSIHVDGRFKFEFPFNNSPQKINITIEEYIRYENIKQPYPVLLRFNDENGNEVSWGGKFRVGSTITRIGSIDDPESNLLNGLYSISGLSLNGKPVTRSTSIVEKQMVFRTTATYLLDDNEPKCILSPRLLRIPNSSYKILGHIPDISGHGNHGKINNSAYAEGSGVNEDGSYQFDGVNDLVTIPTLSSGGKQVLMKVNQSNVDSCLYTQVSAGIGQDRMTTSLPTSLAYQGKWEITNWDKVYIDGIENNNITNEQLYDITHIITAISRSSVETVFPIIGALRVYNMLATFAKMSLYDLMLFDNISTDDKILKLNKYVGVEAKVELPPYYWDNYGKTNSDEDKATIQQRGVAVGDYDLINYNHAYEGMSGYNGYPVVFGESKTWEAQGTKDGDKCYIYTSNANKFNITQIKISSSLFYTYIKRNGELTSGNKDIPSFNLKVTGLDYDKFYLAYYYLKSADVEVRNVINITSDGIYELPKSFASDGSLTETNSYIGLSFTRKSSEIPDIIQNVNVTIEVLPEYENGLVYDGIEDFSDNKNVPIIDDFTAIAKRTWLEVNTSDKPFIIKGDTLYPDGNKNAFLFEYGKLSTYSFGQNNKYDESVVPSLISYATPTSYNGTTSLVRGSAIDTVGIDIAHATKIVLYKLILYPKTISLLEINFLKNLMEKDEIIDLTNPIFIQE